MMKATGPDADGLYWIHGETGSYKGAVSVRADSIIGRAFAGYVAAPVHTEHCCARHGCKYGDLDCTVTLLRAPQSYPCESCDTTPTAPPTTPAPETPAPSDEPRCATCGEERHASIHRVTNGVHYHRFAAPAKDP
jgi:hypothetical protein